MNPPSSVSKDKDASSRAPHAGPVAPASQNTIDDLMAMLDEEQVIEAIERVDAERQNALHLQPAGQRTDKSD
jgi:hypothetical protein